MVSKYPNPAIFGELEALGYTTGTFNDRLFKYLGDIGYQGSLTDRIAKFNSWNPTQLGTSLYDYWDAESVASLSLSGNLVSSWSSLKNSYSASQSILASKPVWSSSSFNGRPGVTFDGIDDELTYTGVGVFPTGSTPCEMWALVDQKALPTDTSSRYPLAYGGSTLISRRGLRRGVLTGVNQASTHIGDGSTAITSPAPGDFSGYSIIRGIVTATTTTTLLNGITGSDVSVVPSTGSIRLRLGATTPTTATNFFYGNISFVAITSLLSVDESLQLLNYLKLRGGIS